MRPTLSQELQILRHILSEIVAPAVADSYARERLQDVLGALDRLANSWDRVVPDLLNENDGLESLINDILGMLGNRPSSLTDHLSVPLAQAAADPPERTWPFPSFQELDERNQRLRSAVQDVIRVSDAVEDEPDYLTIRRMIRAQLRANLDSVPPPAIFIHQQAKSE